ncbi:uncharacterized protein [Penaeus vannamei]|uniref:uncharacterized protein n=1 Tax=Penaeus vannamei TaxID=6689 RepID=UPI00387F9B1F
MMSLDVDSLFTKVPLDDALAFAQGKLPAEDPHVRCYHGFSPVRENLFMEFFESELLPSISPRPVWLRYVDDVFTLWPHAPALFPVFLSQLDSLSPIRFNVEWEVDNKLPFLNTLVHRSADHFFSICRKPMHSGMYIHFSYYPLHMKRGVATSLFLRALRICDPQYLDGEIDSLRRSFSKLGNPRHVLDVALSRVNTLHRKLVHTCPPSTSKVGTCAVPRVSCEKQYFGEIGASLTKRLAQHKYAISRGHNNNALFCHRWDTGHQMDWKSVRIVFPFADVHARRLVESSLIKLLPNFNLNSVFSPADSLLASHMLRSGRRDSWHLITPGGNKITLKYPFSPPISPKEKNQLLALFPPTVNKGSADTKSGGFLPLVCLKEDGLWNPGMGFHLSKES